jgi:hypothetical protein
MSEPRDWENELESAHALTRSAIRAGESALALLAQARSFVKVAAGSDGEAADLLERIDKAIGPKR